MLALVYSLGDDPLAGELITQWLTDLLGRAIPAVWPEADHITWRAALVAAQLVGLGMARRVVRIEPLGTADRDEIVAMVGPAVQRWLTGPLPM